MDLFIEPLPRGECLFLWFTQFILQLFAANFTAIKTCLHLAHRIAEEQFGNILSEHNPEPILVNIARHQLVDKPREYCRHAPLEQSKSDIVVDRISS